MLKQPRDGFRGHFPREIAPHAAPELGHYLGTVEGMQLLEQVRHCIRLVVLHHLLKETGTLESRLPRLCFPLLDLESLRGSLLLRIIHAFRHIPSVFAQFQVPGKYMKPVCWLRRIVLSRKVLNENFIPLRPLVEPSNDQQLGK